MQARNLISYIQKSSNSSHPLSQLEHIILSNDTNKMVSQLSSVPLILFMFDDKIKHQWETDMNEEISDSNW